MATEAGKLVIIRHGLTEWSGKFTGWTDIDIIEPGVTAAYKYGQKLKNEGYRFDIAYTSYLKRAIRTLWTALDALDQMYLPVVNSWKLNERHYGALQGQSKPEMVEKYGAEQVQQWRRSYNVPPPQMSLNDPAHPSHDPKYAGVDPQILPSGECLADTYERSVPYFQDHVIQDIKAGKNVILSGHHNSLRSIVKFLDNISDEEVVKVNIPYCIPLVYEFDKQGQATKHYYLESDAVVAEVIANIKNQTKR